MLFVGWACTLLWLPSFADKYGRKKLFFIAMVADLILFTGILLARNLILMICLWFTLGLFNSIRSGIGYVFLMEMMPKKA